MSSFPPVNSVFSSYNSAPTSIESGAHLAISLSRGEILAALSRREAILRAISDAATRFLSDDWRSNINSVLARIGTAADVSRVYVFCSASPAPEAKLGWRWRWHQLYEWCAPNTQPQIGNPELQNFTLGDLGMARWEENFERGDSICGLISDFPLNERKTLVPQQIQSLAVVPIFSAGQLWGFLGFDECRAPRIWEDADLDTIRLCAELLGAAIERQKQEETLRESEREMRALFDAMRDLILVIGRDGTYQKIISREEALLYSPPQELLGHTLIEVLGEKVGGDFMQVIETALSTGKTQRFQYEMHIGDGPMYFLASVSPLGTDTVLWVARDVSIRVIAEKRLQEAEGKYRSIFENAVEGIFRTTPDGRYLDANPALARIYGYENPQDLKNALTNIARQLYTDPRSREEFIREMHQSDRVVNFEAEIRRKDGEVIWISENARAVRDEHGEILYYEGTVEDITARKVAQDQLVFDALHDRLTGLSNRALFSDRLSQAFSRFKRHPEELFAVLFLDFDRFKNINDSMGHQAGDRLLIEIAERLKKCLRPGDTVSRLGGDEFAILLGEMRDLSDAIHIAERIQTEVSHPFSIRGQQIFTSASIGIALTNSEYDKPDDLLRDADMAMYRAKAKGKARHEVFDAAMHTRAVALLQLETDLRLALERDELRLFYQPIVALESGKIAGFEALIRWQHPTRGLVPPGDFIPLAEETGWILPMGRWVLAEACHKLKLWQDEMGAPLSMSVNLSGKQFNDPELLPFIFKTIENNSLVASSLKLEITESALINAKDVAERLEKLRDYGVRLGLDDFGTGYSSLSYLHQFPFDTLKIDRSFIARMHADGENRELVKTIVSLGRNLKLDVIAEGIEEPTQLAGLRELQCANGQGFFFSRPLPDKEAFELLKSKKVW